MDIPSSQQADVVPNTGEGEPGSKNKLKIAERKWKKKLDLVKCERCRLDRQKCNPTTRIWPTKCDRCVSRGFPCSEGKRVQRKTKHAALLSKTPEPAPPRDHFDEEDDLDDLGDLEEWSIMLSCNKIVGMALGELSRLKKETVQPFMDQWVQKDRHKHEQALQHTKIENLENIANFSAGKLHGFKWSTSASSALIEQTLVNLSYMDESHYLFSKNTQPHPETVLGSLKRRGDIGHEYIFRQKCLQIKLPKGYHYLFEKNDQATLESLRDRVLRGINSFLHPFQLALAGLYNHPEISLSGWIYADPHLLDCLNRTPTLQRLDATIDKPGLEDAQIMSRYITPKIVKTGDILDRTLLHVACQKGWKEGIEDLMRTGGVDTRSVTIYGHTALHYAAAHGASEICKLLLHHEDAMYRSQTWGYFYDARDCNGNSPLYYAVASKDKATIELLLAHQIHGIPIVWNEQACPPPLIRAILDDEFEIARLIFKSGADPAITFQGLTAVEHLEQRTGQSKDPGQWSELKDEMNTLCWIAAESQDSALG